MNFSDAPYSHHHHHSIHSSHDVDSQQLLRPFSRLDDVVKVSLLNDAVIPTTSTMASALTSSTFSPSNLLSDDNFLLSRDVQHHHHNVSNTTANVINSVLTNTTASSAGNRFIDEAGREFSSVLVHAIICNRLIDLDGYNSTTAAICGMMLFIGIIYISVGYRCFKLTMFLTGFLLGTTLVYLICSEENALGMWGNVGVALGSGLLLGLITMLVDYVGLFTLGLILGALLAVVTLVSMYMGSVIPSSMWTAIGLIFGEALLFALLTLWQSKFFTIFASSAFGAALLAAVMDYFIEKWRLTLWVADRIRLVRPSPNATLVMTSLFNGPDNVHSPLSLHSSARSRTSAVPDDDLWLPTGDHPNSSSGGGQRAGELFGIGDGGEAFVHPSLCWYSWLILLSWPTFLLIGVLTQWLLTSKDYYYYTDHSRHQKLDFRRRQQAQAAAAVSRRRNTTTPATGPGDTSRGSRRARRASTSSVCYVSVEEDNGWHYRHATVPTTGVTAVGTASSSSVIAATGNCGDVDVESAQSTPFGSPCKTTSNTTTSTTTVTTALTTARLLAIGAENALRKAGGGGSHGHHHSSLFAAAAASGGGSSLSRGEPLRDSVKYKQMYRARRANGDVILQDRLNDNHASSIRHDFSPTSASPPHQQNAPNNSNNNFSSSSPPSSSVNSTWSGSSQDQLMPHLAPPVLLQSQRQLPQLPNSNNSRQQPLPTTIKSSTSNHSAITGMSAVQSLPLPPIPTQNSTNANNFVMPHFSNPPTSSSSNGISLYANGGAAAAAASAAILPFSSRSGNRQQSTAIAVAVAASSSSVHTPTLVQQIAPTKQKKSSRNLASTRSKHGQSSSTSANATDDRAFQRLTSSSATAFNSNKSMNETTAVSGDKNNRRKKKPNSTSHRSGNSGNLERHVQAGASVVYEQRRQSSLESSGSSNAAGGPVIEMRESPNSHGVSTKMM